MYTPPKRMIIGNLGISDTPNATAATAVENPSSVVLAEEPGGVNAVVVLIGGARHAALCTARKASMPPPLGNMPTPPSLPAKPLPPQRRFAIIEVENLSSGRTSRWHETWASEHWASKKRQVVTRGDLSSAIKDRPSALLFSHLKHFEELYRSQSGSRLGDGSQIFLLAAFLAFRVRFHSYWTPVPICRPLGGDTLFVPANILPCIYLKKFLPEMADISTVAPASKAVLTAEYDPKHLQPGPETTSLSKILSRI
ncbi:hypothetical protein B0H11DRAFT_1909216 [Mycena galericulata]|nr:hypothetical protein B0H11DRAFT_1909216 [Mycena galericulata]